MNITDDLFGNKLIQEPCFLSLTSFLLAENNFNFTCTSNDGRSVVGFFLLSSYLFRYAKLYVGDEDFLDNFPVN